MMPYAALVARIRTDPATPFVTYRHLGSGERMELSAASLGNAVAKTAGLLRDELDAQPGTVVAVHLPHHWQRVVWLGACAATGTIFAPNAPASSGDICVMDYTHLDHAGQAAEDVLVSVSPFGLPEPAGTPSGVTEAAVSMRAHPDTFVTYVDPRQDMPLIRAAELEVSQGELLHRASTCLAERAVSAGERFALVDPDPLTDVLALAGPLATGSAVVLIADAAAGDLGLALREEGVEPGRE